MPRVKKPLHQYQPGISLAAIVKFRDGLKMNYYALTKDFARERTMLISAVRFINQDEQQAQRVIASLGNFAWLVLFGDCFRVTLHPEILADPAKKTGARFCHLYAAHPGFTLDYMSALRKAASNLTGESRAMEALRAKPPAEDKDILGTTWKNTVKKARQKLAALDVEMWAERRKGKRRKN
jgi:hypothetical protein